MGKQDLTPDSQSIRTDDGREVELTCPVCAHNQFVRPRAEASTEGAGFQHVVVGREVMVDGSSKVLMLPVRFLACANCGYIMKFLLPKNPRRD